MEEIRLASWYGMVWQIPIIYDRLKKTSQVVVWDFWTINSMTLFSTRFPSKGGPWPFHLYPVICRISSSRSLRSAKVGRLRAAEAARQHVEAGATGGSNQLVVFVGGLGLVWRKHIVQSEPESFHKTLGRFQKKTHWFFGQSAVVTSLVFLLFMVESGVRCVHVWSEIWRDFRFLFLRINGNGSQNPSLLGCPWKLVTS